MLRFGCLVLQRKALDKSLVHVCYLKVFLFSAESHQVFHILHFIDLEDVRNVKILLTC